MVNAAPSAPPALSVLWLQSGGCGGCTMSWLCAETPDFHAALSDAGVDLLWHPSLSLETGAPVQALLHDILAGRRRLDVLCVEGAILRGPHGTGRFHLLAGTGVPMMEWVRQLARVVPFVVAVGSCAAWGGITAGGVNPTDACGLQYEDARLGGLLGEDFRSLAGWPVINIAGCPTHPDWVTDTLALLAAGHASKTLPTPDEFLDELGRPRFYAGHLVHHGCTRNEFYEFKASAEQPTDLGCMMEHMGCKGTQVHADCNTRSWNGEGSCTRGGYACIGCTEPGFQDPGHGFDRTPKVAGIPVGLPTDMPKAWFVALASLSKSATPRRVRVNAVSDHIRLAPAVRRPRGGRH